MSTTLAPERSGVATEPARVARERAAWIPLGALYLAAVAYHCLQSLGHRTPAVFTDELLFAKLAQSVAGGEGFVLRGEAFFFPAPVAVLIQAVAWLEDIRDARRFTGFGDLLENLRDRREDIADRREDRRDRRR